MSTELELRRLEAQWDPSARAVLSELRELHYLARAAEPTIHDLPPFVRAVSALRRWQGRSVFVQDDVNALVLGDAEFGELEPVLLPPGPQLRRRFEAALGNKASKLDLEAALVLPDGRLLAFGSGSTPARERLVVLEPSLDVRVVDAHPLYETLRAEVAFAGSELNLEGALVLGASVRLLQRGNGARKGALEPINAFGDFALHEFLAWLDGGEALPRLKQVTRVELGHYEGAAMSLTDIALLGDDAAWVVTASAEASPNSVDDGSVSCSAVGLPRADRLSLVPVVDAAGKILPLKIEGIEPKPGRPGDFDVVIDVDDAARPALLGTLSVRPWG